LVAALPPRRQEKAPAAAAAVGRLADWLHPPLPLPCFLPLFTYSHPQPPPKKWRPAFSARPHPNLILSVPNPAILSTINLTFFFAIFDFTIKSLQENAKFVAPAKTSQ
jgi:hypothetical protein